MRVPKWPVSGDREIELLRDVLQSERWGGHSDMVTRLERDFAAYQHCRFGISAMNGTVTLEMAVQVDTPMIEEICMDNEQDVKLYK